MNIGTMNIDNLIDSMTEEQAFGLVYDLSRKFGWSVGGIVTKSDIEYYWKAMTNSEPTPEQVESVTLKYSLRKLDECLSQERNDCVYDAISEVLEGQS